MANIKNFTLFLVDKDGVKRGEATIKVKYLSDEDINDQGFGGEIIHCVSVYFENLSDDVKITELRLDYLEENYIRDRYFPEKLELRAYVTQAHSSQKQRLYVYFGSKEHARRFLTKVKGSIEMSDELKSKIIETDHRKFVYGY